MKINISKKKFLKYVCFSFFGIMICFLLLLLLFNVILIIKSYIAPEEIPSIGDKVFVVFLDGDVSKIENGDLIILNKTGFSDIKNHDIITFYSPISRGVVTSEVVDVLNENDDIFYKTSSSDLDDVLISSNDLIGVYESKIDGFGKIIMFMSTSGGFVLCIVFSFLLIFIYEVVRRKLKTKFDDKEVLLSEIESL